MGCFQSRQSKLLQYDKDLLEMTITSIAGATIVYGDQPNKTELIQQLCCKYNLNYKTIKQDI